VRAASSLPARKRSTRGSHDKRLRSWVFDGDSFALPPVSARRVAKKFPTVCAEPEDGQMPSGASAAGDGLDLPSVDLRGRRHASLDPPQVLRATTLKHIPSSS